MDKTEFTELIKMIKEQYPNFKPDMQEWATALVNVPYDTAYWAFEGYKRRLYSAPKLDTFFEFIDKARNGQIWNSKWEAKWQAGIDRGKFFAGGAETDGTGTDTAIPPDDKKNTDKAAALTESEKRELQFKIHLAVQRANDLTKEFTNGNDND